MPSQQRASMEKFTAPLERGLLMAALARDERLLLRILILGANTHAVGARALDVASSHGWERGVEILAPLCSSDALESCLRGAITHGWASCAILLFPYVALYGNDDAWPELISFARAEDQPDMAHLIESFVQARELSEHVRPPRLKAPASRSRL